MVKETAREFGDDQLVHWAAALTYYALLSLFPGLLLLVSVLGLIGTPVTQPLIEHVGALAPGPAQEIALDALERLQTEGLGSGIGLVAAAAGALWAGSSYVGGFIPAANACWEVEEARPFLQRLKVRMALTLALLVLIGVTALVIALSGRVARFLGEAAGAGEQAVAAWSLLRWPVLLALVTVVVGVLYRVAPNVDVPHRRWLSAGSVVAVVLWVGASFAFAQYVTTFASYDRTYGALASIVVLLVWLWISNLALLLGLELNATLAQSVTRRPSPGREAAAPAAPSGDRARARG